MVLCLLVLARVHRCPKSINVKCEIRAYRWEKRPKINKRTCNTIPHFRVIKFDGTLCKMHISKNMFFAAKSTNFNQSQETFKVNDIARISGKLNMNVGFFYL